jgi:hypothetical protein
MNTVSFKNDGLIDARCITTVGVSVKDGENPIGFFGTGLKYAIAIILRAGGCLTIWRGLEQFQFDTVEVEIRGKMISVVRMNGQELGFTIELGKHWKIWQAFREIYCNTVDEGGTCEFGVMPPSKDTTTVCVELSEFSECLSKIGDFILQTKPAYSDEHTSLHYGPSSSVFYRSIRVANDVSSKPFLFIPNINSQVELTEDRTLKNNYQLWQELTHTILRCKDVGFLEKWLTAGMEYAEHYIDLEWQVEPGEEFLEVVDRLCLDTSRPLSNSAMKILTRYRKPPSPIEADLLNTEYAMVQRAIKFCRELKYTVDEFPIIIVESLGESILGKADVEQRKIYIARRVIQMGLNTCAGTLIEEWAHIKHGFKDCTREMQNWLFDQVARLGEAYLFEANFNHAHSDTEEVPYGSPTGH